MPNYFQSFVLCELLTPLEKLGNRLRIVIRCCVAELRFHQNIRIEQPETPRAKRSGRPHRTASGQRASSSASTGPSHSRATTPSPSPPPPHPPHPIGWGICDISSRLSGAITEILEQKTDLLDKDIIFLRVAVNDRMD